MDFPWISQGFPLNPALNRGTAVADLHFPPLDGDIDQCAEIGWQWMAWTHEIRRLSIDYP